MLKSFTDRKFRVQSPTPSRRQLEDYLIQIVRQLGKYRAEKLTKEERNFLEKVKSNSLPLLGLFRLDLQFFNRRKEELEKLLKEAEEERTTAAEVGQVLLKKNIVLEQENKKLRKDIDILSSELQREANDKKTAAQLGLELIKKNEELISKINILTEQLKRKVNAKRPTK